MTVPLGNADHVGVTGTTFDVMPSIQLFVLSLTKSSESTLKHCLIIYQLCHIGMIDCIVCRVDLLDVCGVKIHCMTMSVEIFLLLMLCRYFWRIKSFVSCIN